jgi:glycerol 2-dehydrogenase (NADP+)
MTDGYKPDRTHDWLDTWKSLEHLYQTYPDKIKAIGMQSGDVDHTHPLIIHLCQGVSNFSVEYLERLLKEAKIVPAVNQIEMHPSCPDQDVVDYCTKKGIVLTAYSPLGSDKSPLLTNEVVTKIAAKHNVAPATVLISLQANKPNVTGTPDDCFYSALRR